MSGPTPDKLREMARSFDHLDKLASLVLDPIVSGDNVNATEVTVTFHLSEGPERRPISREDAAELQEWMKGDALQRDLRAWADELERYGSLRTGGDA